MLLAQSLLIEFLIKPAKANDQTIDSQHNLNIKKEDEMPAQDLEGEGLNHIPLEKYITATL